MTTIHPAIDLHDIPRKDLLQALVDRHGAAVRDTYGSLEILFKRDGFEGYIGIDRGEDPDAMLFWFFAPHGRLRTWKVGDHFDFEGSVYLVKTDYSTPRTLITDNTAPSIFAQFEDMLTVRAAAELDRLRGLTPSECRHPNDLADAVMVISGTTVRPPLGFKTFCTGNNWEKPIADIIDQPLPTTVTVIDVDNRHGNFVENNLPGFKDNPDRYGRPEEQQAVKDKALITPTGLQKEITARTWRELMLAAQAFNQKAEAAYESWRVPMWKTVLLDGEIATISNRLWDV